MICTGFPGMRSELLSSLRLLSSFLGSRMSPLPRFTRGSFFAPYRAALSLSLGSLLLLLAILPAHADANRFFSDALTRHAPFLLWVYDLKGTKAQDRGTAGLVNAPPRAGGRQRVDRIVLVVRFGPNLSNGSKLRIGWFSSVETCRTAAEDILPKVRREIGNWRNMVFNCQKLERAGGGNIQHKSLWLPLV